jgi:hypothetical protein
MSNNGVVSVDVNGYCMTCQANASMTAMANTALHGTYDTMTDVDQRETAPLIDHNKVNEAGWVLKKSHQCYTPHPRHVQPLYKPFTAPYTTTVPTVFQVCSPKVFPILPFSDATLTMMLSEGIA